MEPYFVGGGVTLYHGDCIEVLRSLPDASVDSVVTDPPYGLEFMGKEWDSFKPAAAHADARTRRASEMGAGTSTRPFIAAGVNAYSAGVPFQVWCVEWALEALRVLKPGGFLLAFGGTRTWHRLAVAVEDAGFEIRDSIAWLYGSGFPKSRDVSEAMDAYLQQGEGFLESLRKGGPRVAAGAWGTALKPAFEPVVVGRKPTVGSTTANVAQFGTGALNIGGTRVGSSGGTRAVEGAEPNELNAVYGKGMGGLKSEEFGGRWPSNVVLDLSQAAELDRQAPATGGSGVASGPSRTGVTTSVARGEFKGTDRPATFYGGERGGASRFFPPFRYEAKASTFERPKGDDGVGHPTVKPLELMQWLVRLVTPPRGTVLEPFAGSGTTVEACLREGFSCVAVEREAEYLPLILQRVRKDHQQSLFGEWEE